MLDHVFLDAIGAVRRSLEAALLERHALEERFQSDLLLGDLSWETSYTLPGEGPSPRVAADITMDWPTWSQTAYRLANLGEEVDEPPEIDIALMVRVQRLTAIPDLQVVLDALPAEGPKLSDEPLVRSGPGIEQHYDEDLTDPSTTVEVAFEGSHRLEPTAIEDGTALDALDTVGPWVASTLVRLADLALPFLPPEPDEVVR